MVYIATGCVKRVPDLLKLFRDYRALGFASPKHTQDYQQGVLGSSS